MFYSLTVAMGVRVPIACMYRARRTKFTHDYGLRAWGQATKIILGNMPDAAVGANFSPGSDYTCPTFQFIRAFRDMADGHFFPELNGLPAMTLPWGEDASICNFLAT